MDRLTEKFRKLGTDNAPGQEVRQRADEGVMLRGESLAGTPVDFSHGDVNAFEPIPGALDAFVSGVHRGAAQAYTEYRGGLEIRLQLAARLATFTGAPVRGDDDLIIATGTQGALFLAVASTVTRGTKVAIVQPDYFANRKLVEFFEGEMVPIRLDYFNAEPRAGLDLTQLEDAFKAGVQVFLFSNPNNPTGVVYAEDEVRAIAALARRYSVTVIADELYSRLVYDGGGYTHFRTQDVDPEQVITIIGPSKTESMSGYRLGVAFGSTAIIDRMEKLQAIVALRAAGYNQAVLATWFAEPAGWMHERVFQHQAIRDDLLAGLRAVPGVRVRTPQAGSYVFPRLPELAIPPQGFVRALRQQAAVTVTPGTEFSPHAERSIRFNFSQDHAATVQAVGRVAEMIERYRA